MKLTGIEAFFLLETILHTLSVGRLSPEKSLRPIIDLDGLIRCSAQALAFPKSKLVVSLYDSSVAELDYGCPKRRVIRNKHLYPRRMGARY